METELILDPGEMGVVDRMRVVNQGDVQVRLAVSGDGPVLREKMMVRPEDATTPALRIYCMVMTIYLEPDSFPVRSREFLDMARELVENVPSTGMIMADIGEFMMAGDFRAALEQCFTLLQYEALLEEMALEKK